MTKEEYLKQEEDEAKSYTDKGYDRGGNPIYYKQGYINATLRKASSRWDRAHKGK